MITSVRIQSYKAHRDTEVALGRLTVLVGPNGTGKTSVLEALRALALSVSAESGTRLVSAELAALRHRGGPDHTSFASAGETEGTAWTLSIEFRDNGPDLAATVGGEPERSGSRMAALFGQTVFHRFDTQRIAAGAPPQARLSAVSAAGGNTAAVLASLKLADDARFDRIAMALKAVVPGVERIRVRRVAEDDNGLREQIALDMANAPGLPAAVLSEGTLVTIALLTSICASSARRLVLLDDIDQALHPLAQIELIRQIKRLLDEMPEVQIVATSHSPFILDELDSADVRVFARRPDGSVAVKSLAAHPEASKMKGALSAGQIWTLDPEEKWVTSEHA
jgi:predicted ATPase